MTKPEYEGYGIELSWWKALVAFVVFGAIWVIAFVRELWRPIK